jgi:hypothetical protein
MVSNLARLATTATLPLGIFASSCKNPTFETAVSEPYNIETAHEQVTKTYDFLRSTGMSFNKKGLIISEETTIMRENLVAYRYRVVVGEQNRPYLQILVDRGAEDPNMIALTESVFYGQPSELPDKVYLVPKKELEENSGEMNIENYIVESSKEYTKHYQQALEIITFFIDNMGKIPLQRERPRQHQRDNRNRIVA